MALTRHITNLFNQFFELGYQQNDDVLLVDLGIPFLIY